MKENIEKDMLDSKKIFGSSRTIDKFRSDKHRDRDEAFSAEEAAHEEAFEKRSFLSLFDLNLPPTAPHFHRSYADLADNPEPIKPNDVVLNEFVDDSCKKHGKTNGYMNEVNDNGYLSNNVDSDYSERQQQLRSYYTSKEEKEMRKKKKPDLKTIAYKIQKVRKYTDCIFVRLFYVAVAIFRLSIASCFYDQRLVGVLYMSNAIIIIDMIYSLIKRNGLDYYWYVILFLV